MNKSFLILLLLYTHAIANDSLKMQSNSNLILSIEEEKNFKLKVRAKNENKNIKFSFLLNNDMREESYLISHISTTIENQVVFNMYLSSNIRTRPIIKFKVKNTLNEKNIEFKLSDNKNLQRKLSYLIKPREDESLSVKLNNKETVILNTKNKYKNTFKAKTVKKAIQELYGNIKNPINEKIKIRYYKTHEAPSYNIPLDFSSEIDMESVAIFSNKTTYSTIAIFLNPENGVIDYVFGMKLHEQNIDKQTITIIGKGRDGKFYKATKVIYIDHGKGGNCA